MKNILGKRNLTQFRELSNLIQKKVRIFWTSIRLIEYEYLNVSSNNNKQSEGSVFLSL